MKNNITSFFKPVASVIDRISNVLGYVAAGIVITTTGLIVVAVIMRYVFGAPFKYTEEISSYMLVAIVFFGLAYTLKVHGHVRVELVMRMLGPRVRKILVRTVAIIGLVWSIELLIGVCTVWYKFFVYKSESFGLLHAPLWIPVTSLVIGSVALLFQLIVEIARGGQPPEQ